jgi:hypothetical protein
MLAWPFFLLSRNIHPRLGLDEVYNMLRSPKGGGSHDSQKGPGDYSVFMPRPIET